MTIPIHSWYFMDLYDGDKNKYDVGLRNSAMAGQLDVLKYFIEKGKDAGAQCGKEVLQQALLAAARCNRLEIVKYLIEKCDVDAHFEEDYLLFVSAKNDALEVMKYLIEECNANVHTHDDMALRISMFMSREHIVKYLIEKCGANVHAGDDFLLRQTVHSETEKDFHKYVRSKCLQTSE